MESDSSSLSPPPPPLEEGSYDPPPFEPPEPIDFTQLSDLDDNKMTQSLSPADDEEEQEDITDEKKEIVVEEEEEEEDENEDGGLDYLTQASSPTEIERLTTPRKKRKKSETPEKEDSQLIEIGTDIYDEEDTNTHEWVNHIPNSQSENYPYEFDNELKSQIIPILITPKSPFSDVVLSKQPVSQPIQLFISQLTPQYSAVVKRNLTSLLSMTNH